jgi:predicted nucleic acid-binding Zn ribbon protein
MSPELPEAEIRRIVRERLREGVLQAALSAISAATMAAGRNSCMVCGFAIAKGRRECRVGGASAHERCATIWIEESKRASRP